MSPAPLPDPALGANDRLGRLEAMLDAVLDLPAAERAAYFDAVPKSGMAVADDLRRLVNACERGDSILDRPAAERFALLLYETPPGMLGERFIIDRMIGTGGMATVYLARDTKHGRDVAVKVIGPAARAAIGADRFVREIAIVARLQHAHIVPLYDSGDDDGWLYYVMPVMRGRSLRERLVREGRIPFADARRIALDLCSALDHAHSQGLVHRDIKPENMLFDDERVMLADFGIAYIAASSGVVATTTGTRVIGTPSYMSPEQASASQVVDARSDVFSLASVIYEMLTGRLPGAPAATITPVMPVRGVRPDVPAQFDAALARALSANPDDRFATAREFGAALATASAIVPEILAAPAKPRRRRARWASAAAAAITLAAVIAIVLRFSARTTSQPEASSIAVQPFDNIGPSRDDGYLADGLIDELTAALAKIHGLSVAPRSSAIVYRGKDSRIMGRELGVAWVVEGTFNRSGSRVQIRPTLINVRSGRIAWAGEYDRDLSDVREVQRTIVQTLADTLRLALLPSDRARLPSMSATNIDAYTSYLQGRYYSNKRVLPALDTAITYFRAALRFDSSYASAYSGLADAYSFRAWSGVAPHETFPLARAAATTALRLDPNLAAAHASLGFVDVFYDWNWSAGQREIDRAIALEPAYAPGVLFAAWYLIPMGRADEAVGVAQRARELEPLSPIINARVGSTLVYARRFSEAELSLKRTVALFPDNPIAAAQLARVYAIEGRPREAIAALPVSDKALGSFEAGIPGFVYASAGNRTDALKRVRALQARHYVPADAIAAIYAGLGDKDAAFAWLDRAYAARAMTFVFLNVEPMFDSLHGDSRFAALGARLRKHAESP